MSTHHPHQPHDKLFKKAFSRPNVASSFLKQWISKELSRSLDWKTLQLVSGNFIDEHLQSSQSDLLYKIYFREDSRFILILLEHQSKEDPRIWYRLTRYIARTGESFSSSSGGIIHVLPLVISQSPRPWKSSVYLKDFIDYPESLRRYMEQVLPYIKLNLIELCRMPYESIRGAPFGVLALKILKAKITNELLSDIIWHDPNMLKIPTSDLRFLLTYILGFKSIDREQFFRRLEQLQTQPIRKKAMTVLEQLHEEGRQEGRQEGRDEGQIWIFRIFLRRKFRSIPRWVEKRLKSATKEDFICWSERILYKDTLEEVFE